MARNGSGTYSLPVNSWNPAQNGVPATAADWQALINDVASALTQSFSRDGQTTATGNFPMGGNKLTGLAAGTAAGDSLRFEQLFSQGLSTDLASAATTDIGAQLTTVVNITGTTTITSFGTNYNGPRFLRFAGALTLTHSATLVLPGSANITTAAGDGAIVVPLGNPATGWRVVAYQTAALAPGSATTATNQSGGTVNATSFNGGQLAGFRNLLINGNFAVNQRTYVSGTATTVANQYTLDRWRVVTSGQNVTFSASGNGNQITAPAGGIEQVIEGINIGGGTYVLNWTGTATATVNGSARAKGESFTLPANTNATVRLIGGTASVVQLEPGTLATPFEHRPYGVELALCKWYTRVISSGATFGGRANGTAAVRATIHGSGPMRATPTASDVAANAFGPTQLSTKSGGAVSVIANTDAGVVVDVGGFSGLTDNRVTTLELQGTLTLSAEL